MENEENKIVVDAIKTEYLIRREELNQVDSKLSSLLTFSFILFGLLIEFVNFPYNSSYGIILYFLGLVLLISCLGLFFGAYSPKRFKIPNTDSLRNKLLSNNKDLIKNLTGEYRISQEQINEVIQSKNFRLRLGVILLLISLGIFLIIKIVQSKGGLI